MFLVSISLYSETNGTKEVFLDEIYKQKIILNIFKTSYPKQDFYEMFAARRILIFISQRFINKLYNVYTCINIFRWHKY